jgi:L-threonylcarbamoyladenylate synthase
MSETIDLLRNSETALRRGAEVLRAGGILAFPTETVYGLGVLEGDPEREARLRELKGREATKPFQRLLADAADAARYVPHLPSAARRLAERFWPGPLTLVLPAGEGGTVGLRCPGLPFVRDLAREAGGAIVATSANPAGAPPACDAETVRRMFRTGVDALLDGGTVSLGQPSTVVEVQGGAVRILRTGAIPTEAILEEKPR